jgi:acetolactate synthase-1/2/3 large subunit
MTTTSVGDVVVDGLVRAGVARIVTVGATLGGAIAAAARRRQLDTVPVASPAVACVLGAVAARLADAPACVVLGSGGLAEARGAVRHAFLDRAPVILVTEGAVAGLDVKGEVAAEPASAAHWTAHALQLALREPRGPVHLVVTPGVVDAPALRVATAVRPESPAPPGSAALDAVAAAIVAADRPVAVAGVECRRGTAATWLRPFAEALPVPVVVTPRARGALPDPHPLMLGILGTPGAAAQVLARADLVVALGVDLLEAVPTPWPSATRTISIGRVPLEGAAASAAGDVALVLEELAPRLLGRARPDWDVAELDRTKRGERRAPASRVAALVAAARDMTPAGTVACADAACAADVSAAWQAVAPDELLVPMAEGLPGFAVAAAVAAALARPAAPVLAFGGAGAASAAALETAARLVLPLVAVIVDGAGSPAPAGVPFAPALDAAALRAALARALDGPRRPAGPLVLDARAGAPFASTV